MRRWIHPSHLSDLKRASYAFLWAMLFIACVVVVKANDWWHSEDNYLALHSFLEVIAICVAVLIFAIVWNTRKYHRNDNLLLLACLMLVVGMFDFSHVLSYKGMPHYFTPSDPDKAIHFWLLARLCSALALLALAIRPWWRVCRLPAYPTLIGFVGLTALLSHIVVFYPHWLPATFVEGVGLTPFKIYTEYVLIALFLTAALLFGLHLQFPKSANIGALMVVCLLAAVSEYFFTLYADVTDTYNLFGHIYKIIAYLFLYRAIYVETVTRPYQEVNQAERQLATTLATLPDSVFELSSQGIVLRIFSSNDEGILTNSDYIGRSVRDVFPQSVTEKLLDAMQQARQQSLSYRVVVTLPHEGGARHFELSVGRHDNLETHIASYLVSARDVTRRIQQNETVEMLSLVVEQNPNPILITDTDAKIDYVNKAYVESSGYSKYELMGNNPSMTSAGKTSKAVFEEMWRCLHSGQPWSGELINRTKQGVEFVEQTTIFPIKDQEGRVYKYISYKNDVTKAIQNEEKIHQLSYYDQLTGLPNRTAYELYYQTDFVRQKLPSSALFYLNLDNFKLINDALGSENGNIVLQKVAERLRHFAEDTQKVYRLTGDVFVCLLPSVKTSAVAQVAMQLLKALKAPVVVDEQQVVVTASMGVMLFAADKSSANEVLQRAESAMYEAKNRGRNNFQFYTPERHSHAGQQLKLINALNFALERDEFSLVYQPQAAVPSHRLIGAEVLLRWHSSELGVVSPARFIPMAERCGLIADIDSWVFTQVVKQLRRWREQGVPELVVAVNLSASRFDDPKLVQSLVQVTEQEGVSPKLLELELTEVVALQNPEQALQTITDLRAAGFRVSLDDFGTGYSSISYLKRFGLDKLKIDKSFVDDLANLNATDKAIVKGIIALAQSLNMTALAEGVETPEQWRVLEQLGCHQVQGYYYSRPLAPEAFVQFVQEHYES